MRYLSMSMALAIAAGASIAFQQVLNANLRNALSSAVWSGFASFAVGFVCMGLLALAMRDPTPSLAMVQRVPLWAWSGGVFGAVFIALGIYLVPKLGTGTFIAFVIAGQLVASLVLDHFGVMGLARRPLDLSKAAGVVLLIAGVFLIRR